MRIFSTTLVRGALVGLLTVGALVLFTSMHSAAQASVKHRSSQCSQQIVSGQEDTIQESYNQFAPCTSAAQNIVATMNSSQPDLYVQLCNQDHSRCTGFQRLSANGTVLFSNVPTTMTVIGSLGETPNVAGKQRPQLLNFTFNLFAFND